MTTEIFLLSLIAGIGYATQGTLLSQYARQFDGFTSSLFRNISFTITLLPLLFLAGIDGIVSMKESWEYIVLSGLFGMMSLSFGFSAHKYLPVAIANSIGQLSPLLLFFWTFLLIQNEVPTVHEFIFVGIILIGLIILNFSSYDFDHLEKNSTQGFIFAFLGIFFGSISVSMMVKSSEVSDPYAVAYFWEIMIAVFFGIMYLLKTKWNFSEKENIPEVFRVFIGKKNAKLPNKKESFRIALAASPTIIASGAFVTAMGMVLEPGIETTPGSVSALTSAVGAITGISLAWVLYKEKLKLHHIIGVLCIILGIGFMQIF